MKIKVNKKSYLALREAYRANKKPHERPKKTSFFFRTLMKLVALPDILATRFSCTRIGMDKLKKGEPAFFLMNHSSFLDLEIAATVLYPRPFNVVATTDAFIGKEWLMKKIGCIPTKKFVSDLGMVRDINYAVKKVGSSVVMYPEAGYTFDGTATTMADSLAKCVKMLGVPLVTVITSGAFLRQPLYNNLRKRRLKVTATVEYLLSAEEVAEKSECEIGNLIAEKFSFDGFREQAEQRVRIADPNRAEGLERVLYKCPECGGEGCMKGTGVTVHCSACGADYTLDEYGQMTSPNGARLIPHIPDWYRWERAEVLRELESGTYRLDIPVDIFVAFEPKCVYDVGSGRLTHDEAGFHLVSDDGEIDYIQKPLSCYSINSDFNWYERGDIISVGNSEQLFYCFPKDQTTPVAKARLAAEELYKIVMKETRGK